MPDLFALLPPLRRVDHPLLSGRTITVIGVSAVLRDEERFYFEVNRPRHWAQRADGTVSIGVGGIGGGIEAGESLLACLRREVQEELGARFRLELPARTALVADWEVAGWLELLPDARHPLPYIVTLLPPRLGGPGTPDALALVTFLGRPQGRPRRQDLFGLLTVARPALADFLARDEWPLAEALAHPALTFDLAGELPAGCVLRPVLTARALRLLTHGQALPEEL